MLIWLITTPIGRTLSGAVAVLALSLALGAAVEAAYVYAKRKGWAT